jgi:hypothetical protein
MYKICSARSEHHVAPIFNYTLWMTSDLNSQMPTLLVMAFKASTIKASESDKCIEVENFADIGCTIWVLQSKGIVNVVLKNPSFAVILMKTFWDVDIVRPESSVNKAFKWLNLRYNIWSARSEHHVAPIFNYPLWRTSDLNSQMKTPGSQMGSTALQSE